MRHLDLKKIKEVMPQKESTISVFLLDILEQRRQKNPRYSMRAFARDLDIPASKLSEILSGRRLPGARLRERIIKSLQMSYDDSQKFQHLIERYRLIHSEKGAAFQLTEDQFSAVADRENFVLLNLMKTKGFKSDVRWIADRLGYSELVIEKALKRLVRLGLAEEVGGAYIPKHGSVTTTHDIPSEAIKEHHRQAMAHALASIFHDDPSVRDITTIGIPTNLEKIEEAKILIRKFRRKLASLLETGDKTEVYHLNIQLIPTTKIHPKKELK